MLCGNDDVTREPRARLGREIFCSLSEERPFVGGHMR